MPYTTYTLEALGQLSDDPIGAYGKRAAQIIAESVAKLPAPERRAAAEKLLKKIDPELIGAVRSRRRALEARGLPPYIAEQQAIAQAMSTGIARELVNLGRGRRGSTPLLGLGATTRVTVSRRGRPSSGTTRHYGSGTDADPWRFPAEMLNGTVRDHRLIQVPAIKRAYEDAIKRYNRLGMFGNLRLGDLVKQGKIPFATFTAATGQQARVLGRTIDLKARYGLYYDERAGTFSIKKLPKRKTGVLGRISGALRGIGKAIIGIPEGIAEVVKKAGEKLGELACAVVNHPATSAAARGYATSQGAPPQAADVGVDVAKGMCGGGQPADAGPLPLPPPDTGAGTPSWLLPAAIGGGALVLILALRK